MTESDTGAKHSPAAVRSMSRSEREQHKWVVERLETEARLRRESLAGREEEAAESIDQLRAEIRILRNQIQQMKAERLEVEEKLESIKGTLETLKEEARVLNRDIGGAREERQVERCQWQEMVAGLQSQTEQLISAGRAATLSSQAAELQAELAKLLEENIGGFC